MLYIILVHPLIISHMQAMHFVLFTPHSSLHLLQEPSVNPHDLPIWVLFICLNNSLIQCVLLIYSCVQDHLLECVPPTGNHALKENWRSISLRIHRLLMAPQQEVGTSEPFPPRSWTLTIDLVQATTTLWVYESSNLTVSRGCSLIQPFWPLSTIEPEPLERRYSIDVLFAAEHGVNTLKEYPNPEIRGWLPLAGKQPSSSSCSTQKGLNFLDGSSHGSCLK